MSALMHVVLVEGTELAGHLDGGMHAVLEIPEGKTLLKGVFTTKAPFSGDPVNVTMGLRGPFNGQMFDSGDSEDLMQTHDASVVQNTDLDMSNGYTSTGPKSFVTIQSQDELDGTSWDGALVLYYKDA